MKRLLFVVVGLLVSLNLAYANDLLFKASNGALNQNSVGVKKLTDKEMAQVKGGLYISFSRGYHDYDTYGKTYTAFFTLSLSQYERSSSTLDIDNGQSGFRNYSDFALFARNGTPTIQVIYNKDTGYTRVAFATIDASGRYWFSADKFSRDLMDYTRSRGIVDETINRSRF